MGKCEKLLKTLLATPDTLVPSYIALVSEGSAAHLTKLMELKGMPKNEQLQLLEVYKNHLARTKTNNKK